MALPGDDRRGEEVGHGRSRGQDREAHDVILVGQAHSLGHSLHEPDHDVHEHRNPQNRINKHEDEILPPAWSADVRHGADQAHHYWELSNVTHPVEGAAFGAGRCQGQRRVRLRRDRGLEVGGVRLLIDPTGLRCAGRRRHLGALGGQLLYDQLRATEILGQLVLVCRLDAWHRHDAHELLIHAHDGRLACWRWSLRFGVGDRLRRRGTFALGHLLLGHRRHRRDGSAAAAVEGDAATTAEGHHVIRLRILGIEALMSVVPELVPLLGLHAPAVRVRPGQLRPRLPRLGGSCRLQRPRAPVCARGGLLPAGVGGALRVIPDLGPCAGAALAGRLLLRRSVRGSLAHGRRVRARGPSLDAHVERHERDVRHVDEEQTEGLVPHDLPIQKEHGDEH
mmetsp:Transcript_7681/g.20526  ORF Transcript_7681/g.20526 Transcript_7681/m.20526 type:complete len:394 (-) Transcript_7681:584-1765(-)